MGKSMPLSISSETVEVSYGTLVLLSSSCQPTVFQFAQSSISTADGVYLGTFDGDVSNAELSSPIKPPPATAPIGEKGEIVKINMFSDSKKTQLQSKIVLSYEVLQDPNDSEQGLIVYRTDAYDIDERPIYSRSARYRSDAKNALEMDSLNVDAGASGTKFVIGVQSNKVSTKDLVVGSGATLQDGQTAHIEYEVWLFDPKAADGKGFKIDASDNSTGFSFKLGTNAVIPGLEQGMVGMKTGGTRRIVIPASLAYGDTGKGNVPPFYPLVFDVKFLSFN
jgi:FKBP-type peptidyl-prolyl cis-trans isomerase FkpA